MVIISLYIFLKYYIFTGNFVRFKTYVHFVNWFKTIYHFRPGLKLLSESKMLQKRTLPLNTSVNFSIEKECTARCNLPNLFEDMVCCDRCSAWYHYGCVPSNNSNTFSGSLSTKTLNQIIFFPPPKSEYFFQQHWESEYFLRKKT
jgi:hypothetical protein